MISIGNWQYKNGAVVTNIPTDRHNCIWEDKENEYNYYGGYIICESIMSSEDGKLLCESKEMFELIWKLIYDNIGKHFLPYNYYIEFIKILLKINSELIGESCSIYYIVPQLYLPIQKCISQTSQDNLQHFYAKY